jgi:hypothetical protein
MLGWFRRKPRASCGQEIIASQPPGEIFPWPKGAALTALEEIVLALPTALLEKNRPMGEFVFGPDDMEANMPPDADTFFIRLAPQMTVSLAKPCQSYVVANDKRPRRIKITQTTKKA